MKVIENVIDREVVVVKVASSELGDSWTLAEKVRNSFLLMSTKEVTYDKLKTIVTQSNQKTSKKILKFGSKKVNIVLKFLKLT